MPVHLSEAEGSEGAPSGACWGASGAGGVEGGWERAIEAAGGSEWWVRIVLVEGVKLGTYVYSSQKKRNIY